jgi:hypothetical protein
VWEWISSLPIEIVGSVYERGWVINPIGECESEFLMEGMSPVLTLLRVMLSL